MSSSHLLLPGWGTIGTFVQQGHAQRVRSPPTWLSLSQSQGDTKAEPRRRPDPRSPSLPGRASPGAQKGALTRRGASAASTAGGEEGSRWAPLGKGLRKKSVAQRATLPHRDLQALMQLGQQRRFQTRKENLGSDPRGLRNLPRLLTKRPLGKEVN